MNERERHLTDLDALLLRAATEPLEAGEAAYLETLRNQFPEVDAGIYERTAATVLLAALGPSEPVPDAIRARLLERGAALFRSSETDER